MSTRAVFLDKDGTLVEDIPYNVDPALIQLTPGAAESLRLLQDAGYSLFVITNQSGVARGFFTEQDVLNVENRLRTLLMSSGVQLAGFYYCPHHPQGKVPEYATECICRKPRPGMVFKAALQHNIDLAASWFVGDILDDMQAGNEAGCRTVLLDNGHETRWELSPGRRPNYMVKDLPEAAHMIIGIDTALEWSFNHGNKQQRSSAYH
jgi:D-glycero-D-manno-heptose 1,7-bisphosphate phosphatase